MVYLEKEIKTLNDEIDEFLYSSEYIDYIFSPNFVSTDGQDYDLNVDLLLGSQGWRKGLLDDVNRLQDRLWGSGLDEKQKLRYKYLLGGMPRPVWYDGRGRGGGGPEFAMEDDMMPMAMDMADADDGAPMMMEKEAERGPMPAPNAPDRMEKKEKMHSPDKDKKKPDGANDKESTDEEEDLDQTDFMKKIKTNSRFYAHQRRSGWDKFGPRIDFTQTLFFESAKTMKLDEAMKNLETTAKFHLNDQISKFSIRVNVWTDSGKYGFQEKILTSSKSIYSKFNLPNSMIIGDILNIPIQLTNNRDEAQKVGINV